MLRSPSPDGTHDHSEGGCVAPFRMHPSMPAIAFRHPPGGEVPSLGHRTNWQPPDKVLPDRPEIAENAGSVGGLHCVVSAQPGESPPRCLLLNLPRQSGTSRLCTQKSAVLAALFRGGVRLVNFRPRGGSPQHAQGMAQYHPLCHVPPTRRQKHGLHRGGALRRP